MLQKRKESDINKTRDGEKKKREAWSPRMVIGIGATGRWNEALRDAWPLDPRLY